MKTVQLCNETLQLHASGAIHWPAQQMLLIADIHFGKSASFRALGVPVPRGTTSDNLAQLSALLEATQAQHIVFLGDFLHSKQAKAASTLGALARWRTQHAAIALTLVRGNHDARAGDPPEHLNIRIVDEPFIVGPFALCHHPQPVDGHYALAGHWHPCVSLAGRARERLRLPCFWFGDEGGQDADRHAVGILPAFGDFTGMHPIEPGAGDRVLAIAGDAIRDIPFPLLETHP
jgi:uncharacterized protein